MTTTTSTTTTPEAVASAGIGLDDKNQAIGRLVHIGGRVLNVQEGTGKPSSYPVSEGAEIFLNGQPSNLQALKEGMQVDLELKDGSALRVDASN